LPSQPDCESVRVVRESTIRSASTLWSILIAAVQAGCAGSSQLHCSATPPIAVPSAAPQARFVPVQRPAFDQSCRAVCDQISVSGSGSVADIEAVLDAIGHVDEAPVLSIAFTKHGAHVMTGAHCTGVAGSGATYEFEKRKGAWRITAAQSSGG
jgi:hypothetical protein